MQRLDHQTSGGVTITAAAELLPQLPPALIGEQLPLVPAVQQRPRLAPQRIDQVLQLDAPRPSMALDTAVEPHQVAAELPAEQELQPVVEDPQRELLAVVVCKAKRRQGPQRRFFLLQPDQPRLVVLLDHLNQEGLVRRQRLEIAATA